MLGGRGREVGKEKGAEKTLKDFRRGAEERDRTVRSTEVKGLIGFRDGKDEGMFLNGWEVGVGKG